MTKLDMVIKELKEEKLFSYVNRIKAVVGEGEEILYKHIHGQETDYTLTWEDVVEIVDEEDSTDNESAKESAFYGTDGTEYSVMDIIESEDLDTDKIIISED